MDYYKSEDLKRFGEIGKFSKELMDKFFDYYDSTTHLFFQEHYASE